MKKREFKTESKRVLDLMINSIYTNKELPFKADLQTVYIQIFTLFKFDKNLKKYNRKTTLFIVK